MRQGCGGLFVQPGGVYGRVMNKHADIQTHYAVKAVTSPRHTVHHPTLRMVAQPAHLREQQLNELQVTMGCGAVQRLPSIFVAAVVHTIHTHT